MGTKTVKVLAEITADYERRTPASRALFHRARRSLVSGTTGNLRHFDPYPLYFDHGHGVHVTDVDGHRYLDCFLGNGPLLLGHNHPEVMDSIARHLRRGLLLVNPSLAADVAERVVDAVPCAESVRFLNSGTEAAMTAVRCARAYTGRPVVVKFFGHYHGQDDQFLVGVGPTRAAIGAGVSDAAVADTRTLSFRDLGSLGSTLARQDVAAVILDPAMHVGGLWGSDHAHLSAIRDLCGRHGTMLIFDEVITGFRLARGGAQEFYSVVPDLAVFAKALSAGEKLSAVAGRAEILEVTAPDPAGRRPQVFQSGTTNDGTVALAAADAALQVYRTMDVVGGVYASVEGLANRLADGLIRVFADHQIPLHVNHIGSVLQLFVTDAVPDFETYACLDTTLVESFYLAMIIEGILLSLPGSNHVYLSLLHDDTHIDAILEAAEQVLTRYDLARLLPG